jgi:hypothetical protein
MIAVVAGWIPAATAELPAVIALPHPELLAMTFPEES